MGYGLLLFGYILAFFFSSGTTYFFADVVGACIMAAALYKLSSYDRGYFSSLILTAVYAVVCFAGGAMLTFGYSSEGGGAVGTVFTVLAVVKLASIVLLHDVMLAATARMCVRADLPKYAARARRNFVITIIYCALDVIVVTAGDKLGKIGPYLAVFTVIFGMVWLIMNAYLIFRCFQLICEEGDEAAEPKKSKYGIVNKISDKVDRLGDLIEPKTDDDKAETARSSKKRRNKKNRRK